MKYHANGEGFLVLLRVACLPKKGKDGLCRFLAWVQGPCSLLKVILICKEGTSGCCLSGQLHSESNSAEMVKF